MLRMIWQYVRNNYTRRRFGLDQADIQHIRADLRFRLALVEYAYFGRSGKKVARRLAELRSLLGDRAIHRYLRSLDPDLRTQFVERFQSRRRDAQETSPAGPPAGDGSQPGISGVRAGTGERDHEQVRFRAHPGSNVVPIDFVARRDADSAAVEQTEAEDSSVESKE